MKIKLDVNNENQWFEFGNGVHLDNDDIQQMVDEVVARLADENYTGDMAFQATGDTCVFGFRSAEHESVIDDDNWFDTITIIVAQNYKEGTISRSGWEVADYGE